MQHIETEVKFYLQDPRPLQQLLHAQFTPKTDRRLETNLRLDDARGSLSKRPALLRLRQDDQVTLTYKSSVAPSVAIENQSVKARQESEVTVSDFDTMRFILEALGFKTIQVYEKYRQEWQVADALLCFDQMPFGTFLEIEGPVNAIRQQAQKLELDWSQRILTNYLSIFAALKSEFKLSFHNVTFAHFEPLDLPAEQVHAVIRRFQVKAP